MRLKSSLLVSALVRRSFAEGAMAAVVKHGSDEAGAIFVRVSRLDGTTDLYGPAPQASVATEDTGDRLFERLLARVPESVIDDRLRSELKFDSDLWIVEIEDRAGRHFLDLAKSPPQ